MKRGGLGRGLDVLLPQSDNLLETVVRDIAIDDIDPNSDQPRREFDKAALEQLADSIREGDISVSPAHIKEWSACQWCEYSSVCGYDPSLPHCTKRVLPSLTRQELLISMANDNDTAPRDAKNE